MPNFYRCRIRRKFCTRVRLKSSSDQGEFELDWARSKNNIAENSFALRYETHDSRMNPDQLLHILSGFILLATLK